MGRSERVLWSACIAVPPGVPPLLGAARPRPASALGHTWRTDPRTAPPAPAARCRAARPRDRANFFGENPGPPGLQSAPQRAPLAPEGEAHGTLSDADRRRVGG